MISSQSPASGRPDWLPSWSDQEGAGRVRTLFSATFGEAEAEAPAVWAAPGRVNLIGEHTDYNAGLCLPIALPHRTYVAVRPRTDDTVRLVSAQEPGAVWSGRLADVAPGAVSGWPAYVVGVAWALREAGLVAGGFDAAVDSCVPYGAGLSSSAALECAFAIALDEIGGLGLGSTDTGRATLAAASIRAENEIAGAPTGGMDQAASLRCIPGHALLLDCRPALDPTEATEQIPFDLAAAGLALLVVDTRAEHQLVDGQYAARRATCDAAASTLELGSLRELADAVDASPSPQEELAVALDRLGDDLARRRVRHVVTEIERVREFIVALRAERFTEAGAAMNASHDSLRDDYEVSCPELEVAVNAARTAGALGARMTGGGFGGSAIALVQADDAEVVAEAVRAAFADAGFTTPGFLLAIPAQAAARVG
jgi:UDPglucose--hexose-1-phosphate uridylyltransferase